VEVENKIGDKKRQRQLPTSRKKVGSHGISSGGGRGQKIEEKGATRDYLQYLKRTISWPFPKKKEKYGLNPSSANKLLGIKNGSQASMALRRKRKGRLRPTEERTKKKKLLRVRGEHGKGERGRSHERIQDIALLLEEAREKILGPALQGRHHQ